MKDLRVLTALAILALATGARAQTPPATPAQTPAKPQAQAAAPRSFPPDAKLAYVDISRIAAESSEGKAARAKLTEFQQAKKTDLQKREEALQAARQKLTQTGMVLSDTARAQLQKDVDRLDRELQRATQDAQDDTNRLNKDLLSAFQKKVLPLVSKVAAEKGLHEVFSLADTGFVWYDPSLDITAEVLKRLEAATPAPAAATPPKKP
jgi:outer membrane protein